MKQKRSFHFSQNSSSSPLKSEGIFLGEVIFHVVRVEVARRDNSLNL
jgi:hypothetical protein